MRSTRGAAAPPHPGAQASHGVDNCNAAQRPCSAPRCMSVTVPARRPSRGSMSVRQRGGRAGGRGGGRSARCAVPRRTGGRGHASPSGTSIRQTMHSAAGQGKQGMQGGRGAGTGHGTRERGRVMPNGNKVRARELNARATAGTAGYGGHGGMRARVSAVDGWPTGWRTAGDSWVRSGCLAAPCCMHARVARVARRCAPAVLGVGVGVGALAPRTTAPQRRGKRQAGLARTGPHWPTAHHLLYSPAEVSRAESQELKRETASGRQRQSHRASQSHRARNNHSSGPKPRCADFQS